MRRATAARGGFLALMAAVATACGSAVPSPTAIPTPASGSLLSSFSVPPPATTASPSLINGVRVCDYQPGTAVASMPPRVLPPEPPLPSMPPPSPVDPAATRRQLAVLDELVGVVAENYVDPALNGKDWAAIGARYRQAVGAGLDDEAFYAALDLMIAELGDSHSYHESPTEVAEARAALEGQIDFVGIGVLLTPVVGTTHVAAIVVFPDGPAAAAGLRPHDSIVLVDGQDPVDSDGVGRIDLFRGPPGTSVRLSVARPGEAPRELVVERAEIRGGLPIDVCLIASRRVAYLAIPTLLDRTVPDKVRLVLEALTADEPLAGLVLDNRMNGGGSQGVLKSVLGLFLSGEVGEFRGRSGIRSLQLEGEDVGGSQQVPMVVLVGPDTASYGEVLSGVLQAEGRAGVIGETSGGNVESLTGYELLDGSKAWIAHETFIATRATYGPWEETGIVPDRVVPARWDLFTEATDPALPVALEMLGLP